MIRSSRRLYGAASSSGRRALHLGSRNEQQGFGLLQGSVLPPRSGPRHKVKVFLCGFEPAPPLAELHSLLLVVVIGSFGSIPSSHIAIGTQEVHGIRFGDSDAKMQCGASGDDAARRERRLGDSSGVKSEILRSEAKSTSVGQRIKCRATESPVQGDA